MNAFKIDFLDHVAIRVKDIDTSIEWYENVLGLTTYKLPEWKEFPVFMLSGKSGIALFPANSNDTKLDKTSKNVKIDHFAFNVSLDNFNKARIHYDNLGIDYDFQDHYYFHSIYTLDPDGHKVELTTIMVDESSFYKSN